MVEKKGLAPQKRGSSWPPCPDNPDKQRHSPLSQAYQRGKDRKTLKKSSSEKESSPAVKPSLTAAEHPSVSTREKKRQSKPSLQSRETKGGKHQKKGGACEG